MITLKMEVEMASEMLDFCPHLPAFVAREVFL
jgi:hypothetical protein